MGLFDKIFGNRPKTNEAAYQGGFTMLNGYTPTFTKFGGNIYESELIRAAINARATHISKLKIELLGSAKPSLQTKLQHGPNQWTTWNQFLYRLSTCLDVFNSAFICPVFDQYGEISGIFAPVPDKCTIVQYKDIPYLRYEFAKGQRAAVELDYCGIMTKFQFENDFLGESNRALLPTMDLIHIQRQGIQEGVKASASYRFMAQLSNYAKASDLANERKRFTEENLSKDSGGGGLLLFPNTYQNISQIKSTPYVIDAEQMKAIRASVCEYFGVSDAVLENRAFGDEFAAFYEGVVEPFAIQFSEVMTRMLFTFREQTLGNKVMATSNRLQFMTNKDKLDVSAQLLDRGIMSINDVREIWSLPAVDGGDARIIRGEYYNAEGKINDENDRNEAE